MTTVLIGYDGSPAADRAVDAAGVLFAGQRAVIATAWEDKLALLADPGGGMGDVGMGIGMTTDPATVQALDDASRTSAHRIATHGAARARTAGFAEAADVVSEHVNIAETLIALAAEYHAAVIVVGSRGHSGVLSRLMGTTTTSLLHHAACPVLVVPAEHARGHRA